MKIYTRTGDSGSTGLFGGDRVAKDHPRLSAYGSVDEVNSVIGFALSLLPADTAQTADLRDLLAKVQQDMFVLGADLATPEGARPVVPRVSDEHITELERAIDGLEAELTPLQNFIIPGGHSAGAALHVARTVCRRAERAVVTLAKEENVDTLVIKYLNRLSDLLFVAARWVNSRMNVPEVAWKAP